MNPDILMSDCDNLWYSNLDDSVEYEGDTSSSVYSPCPDDSGALSSFSSQSPSPAHEVEKRSLGNRVALRSATPANLQPVNIGHGIYYYGEIGSRSAPGSPSTSRRHLNYQAKSSLANGMTAGQGHRRASSVRHHQQQVSNQVNGYMHSQPSSSGKRVHISNHTEHIPVPSVSRSSRGSSKSHSHSKHSSGVSCYSAFSFGSRSKKHKLPKVLRRGRSKSEKSHSNSKSKHSSPGHSISRGVHVSSAIHPRKTHGYLSDGEGYRRSQRSGFTEQSRNHKTTTSHGYYSDYEVVRHHKHTLQVEGQGKGYSSGYETTNSFFSGSEWSEDEAENGMGPRVTQDDVFMSPHRTGRSKSTGTVVLHKLAKKFGKMSVKSGAGDPGEGSDGSGGGGSTSWSKKAAKKKKKLRSNSVSNLADPEEPGRLSQSMEQLDVCRTPGGTPTGTPKMTRSSSKTRLGRRGSEPDLEGPLTTLFRSGSKRNLAADPTEVLFELIEQGKTEDVEQLLYSTTAIDLNLSNTNDDDLLPLDLAAMLNHEEIAKLLLEKGAKDSTKFCKDTFSRFSRIASLLSESERELDSLKHEMVTQSVSNSSGLKELERRLRKWEWKSHIYKKMKHNFEYAAAPDPPADVSLHVTSNRSLTVTFTEPLETNGAVVTRYKIEWCRSESFYPIVGEFVMTDLRTMEYAIPDLDKGEPYFVRVSAYNMKGFGPACLASPSSAVPSSWHDEDNSHPRYEGKTDQMYTLSAELSMMLSHSPPISPPSSGTPSVNRSTKTSLRKGITRLFGSNIKFHKTLRSGVYIASLVYSDDSKVLVTQDDQIPILEVSDSDASKAGPDFVWLAKVACTWEHIRSMCESSDNYTSSPAVQFRNKLLHAVLNLQEALGMQDLGLLHPVPYKDKHGASVFVLVQYLKEAKLPQASSSSFKWSALSRLWKRRTPPSSDELETLPVPDQIVFDAHDIMAYHINSTRKLAKGLYLGYLKGRSTVASIKVICSREYPNVLPYMKIRNNPNISRDEWQWFKSLSSPNPQPLQASTGPQSLQETLLPKIETFLHNLGIAKEDFPHHQLYKREAIELNEDITFLLLLPPAEHVCTPPGSTDHFAKLPDFVALPINTFEIMQLYTYQRNFMTKYSVVSARLEVELLTSTQRMREAFSKEEVRSAKKTNEYLEKYQERADPAWKQMRWIEEAVQKGRGQSDSSDSLLSVSTIREGINRVRQAQYQQQLNAERRREREAALTSRQHQQASLSSGYLRVFPAYNTGLVKGTSVKLFITLMTTTTEVIRLVVHQLEKARLERGIPGNRLTEEDLADFYLVGMTDTKEWIIDSRAHPLSLQSSTRKLEVRRRSEHLRMDEHVTSV